MAQKYLFSTINSALLFVITFILGTILHEAGHFAAAILVGAEHVSLHHNFVDEQNGLSVNQLITIGAAGPLVSLALGVLFTLIFIRQSNRNLFFLFNVYMAFLGYISFFGYLMTSPFSSQGDTGFIFTSLNFPVWLVITISVISAFILFRIAKKMMRYFVEMAPSDIIANPSERHIFFKSLIYHPLLIGIIIVTLLSLPVPAFLSILKSVCMPLTFLWAYRDALNKNYESLVSNDRFTSLNSKQPLLFIIFITIVIINRLLVLGINYSS